MKWAARLVKRRRQARDGASSKLRDFNKQVDAMAERERSRSTTPQPRSYELSSEDDTPDTLPEAAHQRDERREPESDPRRDDDVPIDVVRDPFPSRT